MTHATEPLRGNPRIAPTAHFTAQAWRRAGFAGAELFDTWLGRMGYDSARVGLLPLRALRQPAGQFLTYLQLRHQWIEQRLDALAPGLVIEIGAGLSPRGLIHARRNPDTYYLELDLPDMVAAKRRRMHATALPDNYRLEALDLLAPDFADAVLRLTGSVQGPCLVVTEGVVDYLSFVDRRAAWKQIAALLRQLGGGHYLLDLHVQARIRAFGLSTTTMLAMLEGLTGHGFGPNLFSTIDEGCDVLRAAGFDDAAALDTVALDAGELPVPPKGRFFDLVEACIDRSASY